MVGLFHGNEESRYWEEVKHIQGWWNLVLNLEKTKDHVEKFHGTQILKDPRDEEPKTVLLEGASPHLHPEDLLPNGEPSNLL